MLSDCKAVRTLQCAGILVAAILLAGFSGAPALRGVASFLIVEDSLGPSSAIVALGGQTPFREIEAAKLYHDGLAPRIVIVREAPTAESEALRKLGVKKIPQWQLARAVLIQQGVPDAAILIPEDDAVGTLEELQAVWGALGARSLVLGVDPVRGVSREASGVKREELTAKSREQGAWSGELTQRTLNATNAELVRGEALGVRGFLASRHPSLPAASMEQGAWSTEPSGLPSSQLSSASDSSKEHGAGSRETEIGSQRSEVRDQKSPVTGPLSSVPPSNATNATVLGRPSPVASLDAANATNAINAPMPVILVTSKYHTRRTRLTWQYVSGGRSQPIVRAASGDPFDPERWWKTRSSVLSVVREYLGLMNYYAGFPVTP